MLTQLSSLSVAQLKRAVAIKEAIATLETELGSLLGTAPAAIATATEAPQKLIRSAAARAKMSAAQKARWAARKRVQALATVAQPAAPAKQPSGRTPNPRLSAIAKARWAKIRARGGKTL